jgi:hypothetical protein
LGVRPVKRFGVQPMPLPIWVETREVSQRFVAGGRLTKKQAAPTEKLARPHLLL